MIFAKNKFLGMFTCGIRKNVFFYRKVFQPFIFGDVINLRGLKNVFFYREIVFQNL